MMRHWFRDLPIRRKLALMTLASSVIALVFAAVGVFTWDVVQYRREIARDLSAQARTIGENSTASITFDDPRSAGETLAVLEIHPNVEYACMFRADGSLFATYFRDGGGACPAAARRHARCRMARRADHRANQLRQPPDRHRCSSTAT